VGEYRIADLARESGIPVRNIRLYQERRILPPPVRRGRVGIYSDAHLERLRLIARLLGRGYTLAHVQELTSAWEQGRDLGDVLGLPFDLPRALERWAVLVARADPETRGRLRPLTDL
jgi:DNA-binding transcriptional MerR regulator